MKLLRLILATALLALGHLAYAGSSMSLTGVGSAGGGGGSCTTATFDLDGTPVNNNANPASSLALANFSTSFCNDQVWVTVLSHDSVTSITDSASALTFTQRSTVSSGSNTTETWSAPLSGAKLTNDTITVHMASSDFVTAVVYAFSGYKTASPYDGNALIPNTNAGSICSWTTSNANDILIGQGVTSGTSPDTGFTLIYSGANFLLVEYQIVSATQSALLGSNTGFAAICDAIQKGP